MKVHFHLVRTTCTEPAEVKRNTGFNTAISILRGFEGNTQFIP